jgi:acyl-homoserine lactone acylase PvdQ
MVERVTVYRDRFGVPHIYGESLHAAAYGCGYAQACDHLEPMLRSFLWACGRSAEVDGEQAVPQDIEARHFKIPTVAQRRYCELSREVRDICDGFAAGVNRYMRAHEQEVPEWWHGEVAPEQIVALAKRFIHHCDMAVPLPLLNRFKQRTFEIAEPQDAKRIGLVQEREPLRSNMWAIMPQKSLEGVAVFSGDPHVPLSLPFQIYEAHLNAPGLNVAGGMPFGLPLPTIGFNDSIAWSYTANDALTSTFFLEEPHPHNPDLYRYDGEWRQLRKRNERLRVRENGRIVERDLELLYTHRGPAFRNDYGQLCSIQTAGYHLGNFIGQTLEMCRARNVFEFKRALAALEQTSLNCMCADRNGTIYYVNIGRLARRSEKYDWRNAVPGWSSETEWGEIRPFEELAQVQNPGSGFLQNCNVQAWHVTADCPIRETDYPDSFYVKGDIGVRHRADRIMEIMIGKGKFSIDEMKQIVFDEVVGGGDDLKRVINRAVERAVQDDSCAVSKELVREIDDRIQRWDNRANVESIGSTLFHTWLWKFESLCPGRIDTRGWSPTNEELSKVAEALTLTGELLMRVHGTFDVPYGTVHQLVRKDLRLPIGGGVRTIRAAFSARGPRDDGMVEVDFGQGYIMVVAFTDPVQAYTCLPFGISEHPDSPHFADQAHLYARGELKWLRIDEPGACTDLESGTTFDIE